MLRRVRGLAALACALAAGLSVAACGSSGYAGHPPASILQNTLKATGAATSFNLAGNLTESGTKLGASLGYRAPSSLSAQITEGANLIRIIVVPAGSYIYANRAFWKQEAATLPASELSRLANHWFKTTSAMSSSFTTAFQQLTPAKIAGCLARTFTRPTVAGTQTINGQSAVELHSRGTAGSGASDLYVATSAPHYLMRLSQSGGTTAGCDGGTGGSETGSVTFSQWNRVSISAPPGAKALPGS